MTPALIVAAVAAVVIGGLVWALLAQRKEIERQKESARQGWQCFSNASKTRSHWGAALMDIEDATRDGKSGTARKVHRMAVEALK